MSSPTALPGYFQRYIDLVPEKDLQEAFRNQETIVRERLNSITEEKAAYAYAEGKWTIKELLQHINDSERIFAYRALCFARGEQQTLPGYEEDDFARASLANRRNWQDLVDEFFAIRQSTVILFRSFTPEMMQASGTAYVHCLRTEQIGFLLIGHVYHHLNVLKERYL